MRVDVYDDPAEFLAASDEFLLRQEAANNLVLSFARMLVQSPGLAKNFFVRLVDGSNVVGAALWVPGRKLVATSCPNETPPLLVDALLKNRSSAQKALSGLYAPILTAQEFARVWTGVTGAKFETGLEQKVMQVELTPEARKPKMPDGRFRRAWLEDFRLLRQWAQAMAIETKIDEPPEETAELVKRMIEARRLFVWDAGGLQAMGGFSGVTPNGARINSIYVPPEKRRNGFARACTWAIGENLRQSGKKFACLFVDAHNPTAISLYQSLGYKAVGDLADIKFKD